VHRQGGTSRWFSPKILTTNRIVRTVTFKWSEIRDDYFSALRRLCMAFFVIFDQPGLQLEDRVTREWVERQFAELTVGRATVLTLGRIVEEVFHALVRYRCQT
jgi:hypothetical protein